MREQNSENKGQKNDMFDLTTQSAHFIYGYMASEKDRRQFMCNKKNLSVKNRYSLFYINAIGFSVIIYFFNMLKHSIYGSRKQESVPTELNELY